MLHIILLILKIIGIVLLCVLGILILAVVCLLFVPIRYRLIVTRKEGENQPPIEIWMKATWLLHFVNVLIRYPADLKARVRVMFFTIWRSAEGEDEDRHTSGKEKKKSGKKKAGKTEKEKEEKETKTEKGKKAEEDTADEGYKSEPVIRKEENQENPLLEASERESQFQMKEESGADMNESPSFWDKLRALPVILKKIVGKIKSLFENIQYTIRRLCDRIKSISDNIQYYKEVVESGTFQNAYGLCKEELIAILRCLKPQKVEGKLIVGMDDPAATAKILSICGMLYPILGGAVDVDGDFERKRIEGRVFIKGKIRCFTILRAAVRIYYNKDIKTVHRLLKKEAV